MTVTTFELSFCLQRGQFAHCVSVSKMGVCVCVRGRVCVCVCILRECRYAQLTVQAIVAHSKLRCWDQTQTRRLRV